MHIGIIGSIFLILGAIIAILQRKKKISLAQACAAALPISLAPTLALIAAGIHNKYPAPIFLAWALIGATVIFTWPILIKSRKTPKIILCASITAIIILFVSLLNQKIEPDLPENSVTRKALLIIGQSEMDKALGAKITNGAIHKKGYHLFKGQPLGLLLLAQAQTPANKKNTESEFSTSAELIPHILEDCNIQKIKGIETAAYLFQGTLEIRARIEILDAINGSKIKKPVRVMNPKIKMPFNAVLEIQKDGKTKFQEIGLNIKNSS